MSKGKSLAVAAGGLLLLVVIWWAMAGRQSVEVDRGPEKEKGAVATSETKGPERAKESEGQKAVAPPNAKPEPLHEARSEVMAEASLPSTGTLGSSLPEEGAGLVLYGQITAEDGSPLAGARVAVEGLRGFHATVLGEGRSDEQGRYRFGARDPLRSMVRVAKEGYVPRVETLGGGPINPGATGVRQVRRDYVLRAGAEVRGRVIDGKDQAVEGAVVVAIVGSTVDLTQHRAASVEATTDEEGAFALGNCLSGEVRLIALMDGYAPAEATVTAPAEGVVLRLNAPGFTGRVEGVVFHKETGAGVAAARVTLGTHSSKLDESGWAWVETSQGFIRVGTGGKFLSFARDIQTDGAGLFAFSGLPGGVYQLSAEKEGLLPYYDRKTSSARVDLEEGGRRTDVQVFLYDGHRIHGVVKDQKTGEPLGEVEVSSMGMVQQFVTDRSGPDGAYSLLVSGAWVYLNAEKSGYRPAEGNRPNQGLYVALDPERLDIAKDIEMVGAVTVSGRVLRNDGSPASDAEVSVASNKTLFGYNRYNAAKGDGTFKVEVTPLSSVTLMARAPGETMTWTDPITVEEQDIADVEIRFEPGCWVSGVVLNDADAPVDSAVLICWARVPTDAQLEEIVQLDVPESGENGQFRMGPLPAGRLWFWAQKAGYADSTQEDMTLGAGENRSDVRLVLRESVWLAGRVVDSEGNPVADARVLANAGSNSHGATQTDESGHFRIEGLARATHRIMVTHPEKGNKTLRDVVPPREDVNIVLGDEQGITFVGTVVDAATKEPVGNFQAKVDQVPFVPDSHAVLDTARPGRFTVSNLDKDHSMRVTVTAAGCAPVESEWYRFTANDRVVERTFEVGAVGTIVGRVVMKQSGEAAAGASVVVKSASSEVGLRFSQTAVSTQTDAEGGFVFEKAPAGAQFLTISTEPPAVALTRKFQLDPGEREDLGTLELGGDGAVIEGRVVRFGGIFGVPNSQIQLSEFDLGLKKSATTGSAGEFRFEDLPNGHYLVKSETHDLSRWVEVGPGEHARVELILGGATIRGQVLRAGAPVSVQAVLRGRSTQETRQHQTDGEGRFEFTDVTPGGWSVHAFEQGGQFVFESVDIEGTETKEVVLRFPSGEIHGRVVDSGDSPVGGAEVAIQRVGSIEGEAPGYNPARRPAKTGEDGEFRFTDLAEGRYTATAQKTGAGLDRQEDIALPDGGVQELTLQLGRAEGGTLLSGTVNVDTGEPIRDVQFRLFNPSGEIAVSATRDEQGILRIENLTPGTYTVLVAGKRYNPSKHDVEIVANETAVVDDQLYEAGSFSWQILGADGRPVEFGCRLEPLDPGSRQQPMEQPSEPPMNYMVMRGIRPGDYRAVATLSDGKRLEETVRIAVGESTEKTSTLGP